MNPEQKNMNPQQKEMNTCQKIMNTRLFWGLIHFKTRGFISMCPGFISMTMMINEFRTTKNE